MLLGKKKHKELSLKGLSPTFLSTESLLCHCSIGQWTTKGIKKRMALVGVLKVFRYVITQKETRLLDESSEIGPGYSQNTTGHEANVSFFLFELESEVYSEENSHQNEF